MAKSVSLPLQSLLQCPRPEVPPPAVLCLQCHALLCRFTLCSLSGSSWKEQMDAITKLFELEDGEIPDAYQPLGKTSAYDIGPSMDAARLLKERTFLKGKKVTLLAHTQCCVPWHSAVYPGTVLCALVQCCVLWYSAVCSGTVLCALPMYSVILFAGHSIL